MHRKSPSVTSELFRAARTSDGFRAALRGPIPYSKRVVRRKVNRTVDPQAPKPSRAFGR